MSATLSAAAGGSSGAREESPSAQARVAPHPSALKALADAVVRTLAYADVFGAPLGLDDLHAYLDRPATLDTVEAAARGATRDGRVSTDGRWYTLAGSESHVERRRVRAAHAAFLWGEAERYGRIVARVPYVRLVAVSGALAVDNVEADADVDLFIVTAPERVWTVRALVLALDRLARRRGVTLCPNYLVSVDALSFTDRTLFTAHELMQLVPLHGVSWFQALHAANGWPRRFLPNARPRAARAGARDVVEARWSERLLDTCGVTPRVEAWERTRKMARLVDIPHAEARFGPECCKGHFGGHGRRVLTAYVERLHRLGLAEAPG
ncbi:MAG: hypothetical protein U0Q12_25740 [Vicinamibacterales bacterium]